MAEPPGVTHRVELRHVPALDGLRGLAVAGVVAFHGGQLTGGYLGVDLFFVLSGFLITSLLLVEFDRSATVNLGRFWTRRARRLLPALFGLVAGVAVYAVVFARPYELGAIRADALATVGYVANWHAIWAGHGYWEIFNAPSPLQHSWSLAIEEQFYLVWPLVVLGVLRLTRGSKPAVLVIAVVGAMGSAALMAGLWLPETDPSRVYLGTDTRAAAVLLGAALATLSAWRGPIRGRRPRMVLEAAGLASLAALLTVWATTGGTSAWLYHYGFFGCGLAATAVIAAAAHPRPGLLARGLSIAPLRGLGLISYGLYLWHWPVFVVMNRERVGLDGWFLFGARVLVSLAFALVSYFVIEQPIRRRGLAAWGRPVLAPVAAVAAVVAVVAVTAGAVDRGGVTSASASGSEVTLAPIEALAAPDPGRAGPSTAPVPPPESGAPDRDGPMARPPGRPARLMVVGDSVAWRLGQSFEDQHGPMDLVVANRALPTCSLGDGSHRYRYDGGVVNQEKPLCRETFDQWARDVPVFRPDAALLLYGGPPQGEREVNGGWYDLCDPVHLAWYRQQVDRAVDILSSQGAVVFLATSGYSRFPWLSRDLDRRTDCLNDVYRQAAASRSAHQVRLLDLGGWTCPEATRPECVSEIDGVNLREDGIHYDNAGADLAARWIVSQVFTPPRPP